MKSKYVIPTNKCCYAYISKDLKKAIEQHQKQLQRDENAKNGKKAQSVTFSFASKDFIRGFKRKWF